MSDVYPPPPPPPPPPPARPATAGYDFLRPLVFVFDDPRWLAKVLIGGLFVLLSVLLVGVPFLFGYFAQLARNVIAGVANPLPEWDKPGEYFAEGLLLFCVVFLYFLPILIAGVAIGVPAAMLSALQNDDIHDLGGGLMGCLGCLLMPFTLAVTFVIPSALLRVAVTRRFGAAFELSEVWSFIRANLGNYLLAFVFYLVARMIGGMGIVLLCIGIVFTEFWSFASSTYAFAQVWRIAPGSATPASR